jgi:hypothetical protein
MKSLGFVQYATLGQNIAGSKVMESVREFYPDAFYMVIGDATEDRYEDCKKYRAEYYHSQIRMGYPEEPYGYPLHTVIEFWDRFQIACLRTDTTHLLYLEDDIKIIKPITFPEDVDVYGFDSCWPNGDKFLNGFTEEFIKIIREYSGVEPNVNGYGAEGGSIFNVKTFLDNYQHIKTWMFENYEWIQYNVYPKMGWQDSFNTYFYLLSGKKLTKNPNICNVFDPEGTGKYDYYGHYEYPKSYKVTKGIPDNMEILHHYKKYYV